MRLRDASLPNDVDALALVPRGHGRLPSPPLALTPATPATPKGPADRLMEGSMGAQELLAMVARGVWTPARCAALGPVPDAVACAWIDAGTITRAEFVRCSVTHWQPHQPLPPAHALHAATFASPGALLLETPMPGAPRSPVRQAYAARMLAALALAKMDAPARLATACSPTAQACSVCGDNAAQVTALAACAHDGDVCADCVVTWMETGTSPNRCPSVGCGAPLTPDDAIRVGAGADKALRLATFLSQRLMAQTPHWRACGTDDCIGGVEVPLALTGMDFDCGVCGKHQRMLGSGTEGDLYNLQCMVVTYLGGTRGTRPVLPCFGCGLPSVKISGCSSVTCPACSHRWSFEAKFVPERGNMVDMGFFDGLERGSVQAPEVLRETVLHNCRRLEIFKEITR